MPDIPHFLLVLALLFPTREIPVPRRSHGRRNGEEGDVFRESTAAHGRTVGGGGGGGGSGDNAHRKSDCWSLEEIQSNLPVGGGVIAFSVSNDVTIDDDEEEKERRM